MLLEGLPPVLFLAVWADQLCLPVMLKFVLKRLITSNFLKCKASAVLLAVSLISDWCCNFGM